MNLSLLTKVTKRIPTVIIKELIENTENFIFINDFNGKNIYPKIFLNGILMGITKNPLDFLLELKILRKNGFLDKTISFIYDEPEKEIKIFCDEGRFIRPVLTVNDENKLNITEKDSINWYKFLEKEHITYLDNNEVEHSIIGMDESDLSKFKCNYVEICSAMMMGVMSNGIPFSDHSQCIFHEEVVYMSDGTTKKIEDVKIGDKVITFNPENQKQTIASVIHTETHPTQKQLHTITTISGRKITATFDHRFMTSEGWKRLEHLDIKNTLIGVSFEPKPVSLDIDEYIVLNNKEFIDNCFDAGIHYTKAEKYLKEVNHLMPLKSNSKFLPVISRIFGFCLTDAWIGISDSIGNCRLIADLTSEYGVELFENDVEFLGFKKVISIFDDRNNGFGSTYRVQYSGCFPALLVALDVTYGKKTNKKACKIPDWIMNGSDMVKREFLSGFHGGDGSIIKSGSDKQINIQIGEVTKTIEPKYLQSLCDMMNDIISLLRYFNINVPEDAKIKKSKDYENRMVVSYYISSARINLIKFFELINYRYDIYKQVESGICVEYLKYLDYEYNKRVNLVNIIKSYGNRNISDIAKELNIPIKDIYNLIHLNGKNLGLLPFKKWKNIIKISSSTIFIPIRSIEKSNKNIISDITIDSENQSFLCGDTFCVHNSPRNIYQCLSPDTNVLMANGNKKQIKDIKIGDQVITFNNKTMQTSITKVINQYVRPTENNIYKLTTVSGREIIATGNHNFMTNEGWCSIEKMNINNTKIGILMNPVSMSNSIKNKQLILSSEQMINNLDGIIKNSLIKLHVKKLENIGLLPLYNDNPKLHIIARIYGFLCTDGSINIYNKKHGDLTGQCQFDFGTELDSQYFEDDIELLCMQRCTPKEKITEYNGSIYNTWSVSHNGEFPSYMISLGISFGKKTETKRNKIPDWIMNGSDNVKREFLSGFQGGDGCQIRWNKFKNCNSYNFVCAETSQSINPVYYESMEIFFQQCIILLKYFDIKVKYISPVKYEINRYRFAFKISDTQENLIKYYDTIGYRYAYFKIINSGKVVEYLKYKNIIVKNHINFVQNIRNDIDSGMNNYEISKKYNTKINKVRDIGRSYENGRKISSPNLYDCNIEVFLDSIIDKSTSLFIPIKAIEKLPNQLISDITVESDNHSFIAGDNFLSSNSSMG